MSPQHGRRYEVSGMEASKTTAAADVELSSKGSTEKNGVTINKIAVPLKVSAAMAAGIVGVSVLTNVLDLILCKCLSVQNVNPRINRILRHNVRTCLCTTLFALADRQTCL